MVDVNKVKFEIKPLHSFESRSWSWSKGVRSYCNVFEIKPNQIDVHTDLESLILKVSAPKSAKKCKSEPDGQNFFCNINIHLRNGIAVQDNCRAVLHVHDGTLFEFRVQAASKSILRFPATSSTQVELVVWSRIDFETITLQYQSYSAAMKKLEILKNTCKFN